MSTVLLPVSVPVLVHVLNDLQSYPLPNPLAFHLQPRSQGGLPLRGRKYFPGLDHGGVCIQIESKGGGVEQQAPVSLPRALSVKLFGLFIPGILKIFLGFIQAIPFFEKHSVKKIFPLLFLIRKRFPVSVRKNYRGRILHQVHPLFLLHLGIP
jgi:hypothetical protein